MSESHTPLLNTDMTRRVFGLGIGIAGASLALSAAGCTNPAEKHNFPSELATATETLTGKEALDMLYDDVNQAAVEAMLMLSDQAPGKTIHLKGQSTVNTLDTLDVRFQRNSDAISLAAVQIRKGKDDHNNNDLELLCTIGTNDPSQADVPTSLLNNFLFKTQISWVITDKSLIAEIRSGRKNWSDFLKMMADPEACKKYLRLDSIDSSKDENLSYTRRPLEDGISTEVVDARPAIAADLTLYPTQEGFTAANNDAQSLAGTVIKKVSGA